MLTTYCGDNVCGAVFVVTVWCRIGVTTCVGLVYADCVMPVCGACVWYLCMLHSCMLRYIYMIYLCICLRKVKVTGVRFYSV